MDITADDLSLLFFKKTIRTDADPVTMDADMIGVLLAVDENTDMRQVARETGLHESVLRNTLAKLLRLRLIEPVAKSLRYLDRGFYEILKKQLTLHVGPMGEVILEDILDDMGISAEKIPVHRTEELIRKAGEQIPDGTGRDRFVQAVFDVIPA